MLERFSTLNPHADLPRLTAALGLGNIPAASSRRGGTSKGWYTVQAVSQTEAEITIFDSIGVGGIQADEFVTDLNAIRSNNIMLRVNSSGGDVFDSFTIFNAIRRHKSTITAFVDGVAASAASFIIQAADKIVMSPHSQLMIHDAHGLALGPADEMRKMGEILDKSSDNIAAVYANRTGETVAIWRERMKNETWFSDSEAVAFGLADSIDGEDEADIAARMTARIEASKEPQQPDPPAFDPQKLFDEIVERETEAIFA